MKNFIEKMILKKIKSKYGDDIKCKVDVSLKKKSITINIDLSLKNLIKFIFLILKNERRSKKWQKEL